MVVPSGKVVKTGYVAIGDVLLACHDRMSIGDVSTAMQRRMSCAPDQPWPCPVGEWQGERFAIFDGRHEYVAALMLGCDFILVAWIADQAPSA